MIKNILFDLDGTLLPFDLHEFTQAYFACLGEKVAHLTEPGTFIKHLLAATGAMVGNLDSERTNQEVFSRHFFSNVGVPEEVLLPVINEFYERDFALLQKLTRREEAARKAVLTALAVGQDVVIATNPVFPMTATRQRIEWAGLGDIAFKLVTSYENSHFCKPNGEYYREIVEKLGCHPEECLMIGNDVEEDLAAATIGMKTYLVTDCLINAKKAEVVADYTGTLQELAGDLAVIIGKP